MSIDEKRRVIKELTEFYAVFKKEILDIFPDDNTELSPLLFKALTEIYFTESITSSILAKRLSITVPNTSRCLKQLDELGYVTRIKDGSDRRITHLSLTEKGTNLVEKAIRSMDELMFKRLSSLELNELIKLEEAFLTIKELFNKLGS